MIIIIKKYYITDGTDAKARWLQQLITFTIMVCKPYPFLRDGMVARAIKSAHTGVSFLDAMHIFVNNNLRPMEIIKDKKHQIRRVLTQPNKGSHSEYHCIMCIFSLSLFRVNKVTKLSSKSAIHSRYDYP